MLKIKNPSSRAIVDTIVQTSVGREDSNSGRGKFCMMLDHERSSHPPEILPYSLTAHANSSQTQLRRYRAEISRMTAKFHSTLETTTPRENEGVRVAIGRLDRDSKPDDRDVPNNCLY